MQLTALPPTAVFLNRLERIADLGRAERQAILDLSVHTLTLAPNSSIIGELEGAVHCCLILKGWLYSYQLLSGRRRQIIGLHIPGDIPDLDGLQLIHRADRGLTALVETMIVQIRHQDLRNLAVAFPSLADTLWRRMLLNASITQSWLVSISGRPAVERVAHFLCEIYIRLESVGLAANHQCNLPVSQYIIGTILNMSTVHVNRTLHNMRNQGLITLHRKVLVINNWRHLVEMAEFDPSYLHIQPNTNNQHSWTKKSNV
ncbi:MULTISPECIES: Crp/Fnr family transcriptional regulator [Methylorubrum]|uniref:Crp/Fnr family transcriptional regulator n=1 Tax=Methylorubrum TaxID=2282523 RepID=UPI00209F0E5E|nr:MULTISPECIES: Crp/Fnr family transcriptional regulator [Methylorubrum]MCP1535526.1 CRP-like cAMP-binding protein [Methylorubrum extorquens]MCY1640649.1 Crp/Fnr family transcriptional regulator [Methylorubrum sp. SL192]